MLSAVVRSNSTSISSIEFEEDVNSEELFEIDIHGEINEKGEGKLSPVCDEGEDVIYVAVKLDSESSMKTLTWTLEHAVTPFTKVHLLHIFPEIRLIPSPMGNLPKSLVNTLQVNSYLTLKKEQIKLMLQKFIKLCNAYKTSSEILLIEGSNVEIAISDLVRDLSIRKLVVGISKSNLSKVRSRRKDGMTEKLLKMVPEICDIKVVCEGKEVIDQMVLSPQAKENGRSHKPGWRTGATKDITRVTPI